MKKNKTSLTRTDLIQYMSSIEGQISRRELARAFDIKGEERVFLKSLLKEMVEEGAILKSGKSYALPETHEIATLKILEEQKDCYIAAFHEQESENSSEIVILKDKFLRLKKDLSQDDLVIARIFRDSPKKYYAQVIRTVSSMNRIIVGVFFGDSVRGGDVEPTHKGERQVFKVPASKTHNAQDGDIVRIEVLSEAHTPMASIIEVIGSIKKSKALSLISIHTYNIPVEFQEKSIQIANKAKIPSLSGRTDLRNIPLVTIDDEDARDFDDAVWAEPDSDPSNPNGWRILVAIADVSHYVLPGTPLDQDAYQRGNSVYFPDQVVPMLPEALSNELCSLKPNEDRGCLAVHLKIDGRGSLKHYEFVHGLMKSYARLTYNQVQAIHNGTTDASPEIIKIVTNLFGAYKTLEKEREHREPLDLNLPERKVLIDEKSIVQSIVERVRLESHKLIEEFMILANVAAAKCLEQKKHLCMYRVHEHPTEEKIESLREFLKGGPLSLAKGQVFQPKHFNQLIDRAKETSYERSIHTLVLRTQAQAIYDLQNIGHFGLNLRTYCHFTSPIRRYADLLVHRALVDVHRFSTSKLFNYSEKQFKNIAEHISLTERQAAAAERDTVDRYISSYLYNRIGEVFKAQISGVTQFALFVSFEGTGADAILPLRLLQDDYYTFDEGSRSVIGRSTRKSYTIGDTVEVILEQSNPFTGQMMVSIARQSNTPSKHFQSAQKKPGLKAGRSQQKKRRR
ncbi:MAG: ribonuclease R [Caedimonadaceae bacterium]|nr:MAG: ribonuclease R [Caedimonadaceae bacterium]